MTTNNRPNPPMPKVANMPAPPVRPNRVEERAWADEALKVAQRHLDQIAEIDRLGQDRDEWRQRAQLAEAEIVRLEKRESDLRDMLDRRSTELIDERDAFRMKLNNMMAQFHTAGAVILKCIEAGQGSVASPVNLTSLAEQIDKDLDDSDKPGAPLPRVVTAGPREVEP